MASTVPRFGTVLATQLNVETGAVVLDTKPVQVVSVFVQDPPTLGVGHERRPSTTRHALREPHQPAPRDRANEGSSNDRSAKGNGNGDLVLVTLDDPALATQADTASGTDCPGDVSALTRGDRRVRGCRAGGSRNRSHRPVTATLAGLLPGVLLLAFAYWGAISRRQPGETASGAEV